MASSNLPNRDYLTQDSNASLSPTTENVIEFNPPASPSKRLKYDTAVKNMVMSQDGTEKIYVQCIQGGFELYYIEKTHGTDGWLNDLKDDINNQGNFSKSFQLLYVANRCISSNDNNVLYNPKTPAQLKSSIPSIPRKVIVRMVTSSSKSQRQKCCEAIAKFLNEAYWGRQPVAHAGEAIYRKWASDSKNRTPRYVVPGNFDRTPNGSPDGLAKLSHCIVHASCIEIIISSYDGINQQWATQNPELAQLYFDPPYPTEAKNILGYTDDHEPTVH